MTETILSVSKLSRRFVGLDAVSEVDFDVQAGGIKAIIGPNGAGKTTIFNMLAGSVPPTAGTITFKGRNITGMKPWQIVPLGIARTYQNVKIFGNMSALQNVMLGRHCRTRTGFAAAAFRLPSARREDRAAREESMRRLDFVGLADKAALPAGAMPFGSQKILEIARALATDPTLILLDEPAAGLNTRETEEMAELIVRIREAGVTVLLVEHDMSLVMGISDIVLVLDSGRKLAEGIPSEVRNDPEVIRVYLGSEYESKVEK